MSGVTVPPLEMRHMPFAIGVAVVDRAEGNPRSGSMAAVRLEIALAAWSAGYFLLDTIEVGAGEPITSPGWAQVWELAAATEPDQLFAYGADVNELEPMAEQLRLLVRQVDADSPERAGVGICLSDRTAAGVLVVGRDVPEDTAVGPGTDELSSPDADERKR